MNKYALMEKLGGVLGNESTSVPPWMFIDCIDNTFITLGLVCFTRGLFCLLISHLKCYSNATYIFPSFTIMINAQFLSSAFRTREVES